MSELTSSQIIHQILTDSICFARQHDHDYFSQFQSAQHPHITMLGCADSRAHTNTFSSDPTDQIFTVRNIGNQIYNNFGSIDFGIYHLNTPVLLINGHTRCGAVKAALEGYHQNSFAIVQEIDHLAAHLRMPVYDANQFEQVWLESVQRNVDYQVEVALRRYTQRVQDGKLTIVGTVYDFTNGYGQGEGHLFIVNINGETSITALKNSALLCLLTPELRELSIQRVDYREQFKHPPRFSH